MGDWQITGKFIKGIFINYGRVHNLPEKVKEDALEAFFPLRSRKGDVVDWVYLLGCFDQKGDVVDWVYLLGGLCRFWCRVGPAAWWLGSRVLGKRCYIIFQVRIFLVFLCFDTSPVVRSAGKLYFDALIFKAFA